MPEPTNNYNEQFVTESIPVGLPWRLLILSITLLGFSIFSYFGLNLGYGSYLDNLDKNLDKNIAGLSQQVDQSEQKNFINFYSQLVNLKKVIDRHLFSGNAFNFLEKNTLGQVYFTDAQYSADAFSLNLGGRAASLEVLVAQLETLNRAVEVDRVILDQMSIDQQFVSFGVTLFFNPDFFRKPSI
jgi:hypothetical protein